MELDKIDKHILTILQVDAKITNAALAQKINLSPAATLERVKKLEQHGAIMHYYTQLDYAKIGFTAQLVVAVRIRKTSADYIKLFKATVDKINGIVWCYHIIGVFDFILLVYTNDLLNYHSIAEKLYGLEMVEEVKPLPIVQCLKHTGILLE